LTQDRSNNEGPPRPEPLEFTTLSELLDGAVERYGPQPAYGELGTTGWQWLSFSELGQRVAAYRAALSALGVGRDDRVAIISGNRLEWVLLAHASYQRRAVFVPLSTAQRESEWRYILADSRAKACFVAGPAVAARVDALREDLLDLHHIIDLDADSGDQNSLAAALQAGTELDIKARAPRPQDLATIIYTSGTTGEPKGVELSHANLAGNAHALARGRALGERPRSMSFLPWVHVFGGHVELNLMLAAGGAVAICNGADQLFAEMPRVKPTLLYAVPRIWTQIYHDLHRALGEEPEMSRHIFDDGIVLMRRQRQGATLKLTERIYLNMARKLVISKIMGRFGGELRLGFSGAAALPAEVGELLHTIGLPIYEGYGLTESSGSSTSNPLREPRFGSVGKPIGETRITLDREIPEAEGDEGEIIIHGPGVMAGYHNNDASTRAALTADGGLRTGDLGRFDADGYLYITGRIKELYKLSSGRYVAPGPLEEKLKLSPFIANCMIYGSGQPYNVALISADLPSLRAYLGADKASAETLLADPRTRRLFDEEILRCSREFRTFELVRKFWLTPEVFSRENGMLTPTLKLRRRDVLKRFEARLRSLY